MYQQQDCLSVEGRPLTCMYLVTLYDLDLDPITLVLDLGLGIMKMYLCTMNENCRSQHSNVTAWTRRIDTHFVPVTLTLTR